MKNMTKLLTLLILIAGFTSCSLFEVDVDTTMSADLEIDIEDSAMKSAAEAYPFDSEVVIDPLDNDDVEEYKDKIERIKATGIIGTVEYVSKKDVVLYKGTMFTISNSKYKVTWTLDDDWPIEQGTVLELPDGGDNYDAVSKILTTMDPFTVSCEGTASDKGVSITIRIDIDTKVTGNPF
jgi:hypothetical protein